MQQPPWHTVSCHAAQTAQTPASGTALSASAHVDAASPWFSGHFPGSPILPGIALLAMVSDLVRQCAAESGLQIVVRGFRKVRFRAPVQPDSALSISVMSPDNGVHRAWHFKVDMGGDTVCSGTMDTEPRL